MALAWSDVTTLVPSMSTVPVGAQTVILAFVTDFLNQSTDAWGPDTAPLYKMAGVLLCCHLAQVLPIANGSTGGASGPVISETLGDASRTYAGPTMTSSTTTGGLQMTSYGQQYLALLATIPCSFGLVL